MPSHDPALVNLWDLLTTRYVVSLGSVGTVERILRTVPDPARIVIRHAKNLSGRDFKSGNLILFASPPNNPWSQLYEDKLNFRLLRSGKNAEFTNTRPKAGEQPHYAAEHLASANSGIGFARIAYLPGAAENTFVLLLTGLNMVTAEAAAEYATNPKFLPELLKQLGAESVNQVPHF